MSMDTTITVDHVPADQAEADRIAGWFEQLAERFDLWEADVSVWVADDRTLGRVYLASYGHKYQIDRVDTLARIVSRLIPGCAVRVEEEGLDDDYWAETATYRSGRMVRTGHKAWVEHDVSEA